MIGPILKAYSPPFLLRNGHAHTIYANLIRSAPALDYTRERILVSDGDFLDLDLVEAEGSEVLFIFSHGLEGSSQAGYIKRLVKKCVERNYSALAWNFRGCSGEPNRKLYSYHSGKSEDLRSVVEHVLNNKSYSQIFLVGISAGGNMTLKYLGEEGEGYPSSIVGASTISVPCDLEGCAKALARSGNKIYMKRFLNDLYLKLVEKKRHFPELDLSDYDTIKNFYDYDNRFTAPQNGYSDCYQYWKANSSLAFIKDIACPALLLSSYDDPFLSETCYPDAHAPHIQTVYTPYGGHVGHLSDYLGRVCWYEDILFKYFDHLRVV